MFYFVYNCHHSLTFVGEATYDLVTNTVLHFGRLHLAKFTRLRILVTRPNMFYFVYNCHHSLTFVGEATHNEVSLVNNKVLHFGRL